MTPRGADTSSAGGRIVRGMAAMFEVLVRQRKSRLARVVMCGLYVLLSPVILLVVARRRRRKDSEDGVTEFTYPLY
jgi:hypothetical protein